MTKEKVSILAIFVNFILGGAKFLVGMMINSAALMADGIHSGVDIFSSFFTWLGIKVARKPASKKYPYGLHSAEALGGLIVTLILLVTGIGIIWQGVNRIFKKEVIRFSFFGILVILISIVVNELMARLKFKFGKKEESLALIADAEHSRADVLSSVGVLVGLILASYFWRADGIIAILVGLYILKESYLIGRETTDNLLGVKDEKVEEEIKKICQEKDISVSDLKSRKIGAATFAELTIKLDSRLRVEEAEAISKKLQEELIRKIHHLKYVALQVESHEIASGFIRPRWGRGYGFRRGFRGLGRGRGEEMKSLAVSEKQGYRVIIPIKDNEIYSDFGAPEYLVVDKENGKISKKEIIKNPYFTKEKGFGMRIVKSTKPDEIITKKIGPGAKQRAEELGIKITIIGPEKKLEDLL